MNILLIQILRLGDALQMIPVIRGLKDAFPNSNIHVLTSTVGKKVFEKDPQVEQVAVLQNKKIAALVNNKRKADILSGLKVLQKDLAPLFDKKWDWVINFSYSYPSALISFMLETSQRSGFTINKHRQYLSKEKWFAHSLASFSNRRYSNFNWVDINKKIIGLPSIPKPPLIVPDQESLINAKEYLRSIGFQGTRIIGLHPGASGDYKRWSIENFGALGKSLVDRHSYRVVIFGADSEKQFGKTLKRYMGDKAEDLVGKTNLDELGAFLSLCDVLVSNDTGPMHLASLVGTQIIALFFNTHFVETGPYGEGHVAVHPDLSCFPCKGPAKCSHKDCLGYIRAEAIEKIVVAKVEEKYLNTYQGPDFDKVRIHLSGFDPWGLLEWIPLDNRPVAFEVIERLLLKIGWLNYSHVINRSNGSEQGFLLKTFRYNNIYGNNGTLKEQITSMVEKLEGFKATVEKASIVALEIQAELLKPQSQETTLRHLGVKLGKTEEVIKSIEKDSSISFLSELMTVFIESLGQSDVLDLSTKTVGVYQNMALLTNTIIHYAKQTRTYLSDAFATLKAR